MIAFLLCAVLAQSPEVIAEIRIHGNHLTSDADIARLSGVTIGAPVTPTLIADVTARLRAANTFDDVQVLKRFASIADPTKITVVIIVNEGPVKIEMPDRPGDPIRVVKRGVLGNIMWVPILDSEDGYGLRYGVRLAYPGVLGPRSRVSFPLTWGGERRAGAELERNFVTGPLTRVEVGAAIAQRLNPFYMRTDTRDRVWIRGEKAIWPVRVGAGAGWQRISFGGAVDQVRTLGADIALDTRLEPFLPRNAVYLSAGVERVTFGTDGPNSGSRVRTKLDARGYIGVMGQEILVLRAAREDASAPLPSYMKPLLGGLPNLRGFEAGFAAGDTLVSYSAELFIPLTSPLEVGKLGVSGFVDAGKAYDKGRLYADQPLRKSIGGSIWMTAAVFRVSFSVAHGIGAGTRVNFGLGLSF